MKKIEISPSILSADFANLANDIKKVEDAGITRLHLDVMDGHFVPNITFGPPLVKSIRKETNLILESHLMIEKPEKFIQAFKDVGSDLIVIHYETVKDPKEILTKIRSLGIKSGISINPGTQWENIKDVLEYVDLVLVMSVNPGFGGQSFIMDVLDKIEGLAKYIKEKDLNIDIEVDGGITPETAPLAVSKGANILVAGASVFGQKDISKAIKNLMESIQNT